MVTLSSLDSSRKAPFSASKADALALAGSFSHLQISEGTNDAHGQELSEISILERLPKELLLHVFSFSFIEDLRRASMACRVLKAEATEAFPLNCEQDVRSKITSLFNSALNLDLAEIRAKVSKGIFEENGKRYKELLVRAFLSSKEEVVVEWQGSWDLILRWRKEKRAVELLRKNVEVQSEIAKEGYIVESQLLTEAILSWPNLQTDLRDTLVVFFSNKSETLEVVLANGETSKEARGEAFKNAGEKGDLEALQIIFANSLKEEDVDIKDDDYLNAVFRLGYSGHVEVLSKLLAPKQMFSKETCRDQAVSGALHGVTCRSLEILQVVLASGSISNRCRGEGVRTAICNPDDNCAEILELLFASGPVTPEDLGWAARDAVFRGNEEALDIVLKNGALQPLWFANEACRSAECCSKKGILILLKRKLLSKEDREKAAESADKASLTCSADWFEPNAHKEIVELLRNFEG